MKKKLRLKKKVKVFLIIFLMLLTSFIIFIYFKPKIVKISIIDNNKVKLKFSNKIGNKCNVTGTIVNKSLNKTITDDLIKDGYDNNFVKKMIVNQKCKDIINKTKDKKSSFKLKGSVSEVVEVKSQYNDNGYILKGTGKVIKINDVDISKIGKQKIIYKLSKDLYNKYIIRNVSVVDTTKPVIELKGKEEVNIYVDDKFEDDGYTASDNYDGDITGSVSIEGSVDTKKEGKYKLIYKVKDSSGNEGVAKRVINVKKKVVSNNNVSYSEVEAKDLTYINGILIVNKKYGLPKDYNPGINAEALSALKSMQSAASALGLNLSLLSGFRSYQTQSSVYNNYVSKYGRTLTDTFSARPGYSEHQTGLAFDIGQIKDSFGETASGKWLAENCHLYGFIIRYPKGKQNITGYKYEPWHVRYLGVDIATKVKNSGLTLEEYLGIN